MSGRAVNPRWSNGYRRRKEQARYRAMGANCYICLQPIDYSLRSPDPWSFVIDETVPIARGGRVCHSNSGPAHRWCNGIKGTHTLEWARASPSAARRKRWHAPGQTHLDGLHVQRLVTRGWRVYPARPSRGVLGCSAFFYTVVFPHGNGA